MTKPIKSFAKRVDAEITIEEHLTERRGKRLFLVSQELRDLIKKSGEMYHYAGVFLGRFKNGGFIPSFPLLFMLADKAKNKIFVNDKAAWLFVCRRDIFKEGIIRVEGSAKKGDYSLVLNRRGECLGYGLILQNPQEAEKGVIVKNILDVGDFLRRERKTRIRELMQI
ncbi:MAG: hypothetical protein RMJ15_09495 [Nitrososphaerota archaeon]|nr:hypothetical protein [Candidatus Bathyarchaeota archaeon]MDW8023950.1 hypothetical protein [Nitrososphaerota archaeon]